MARVPLQVQTWNESIPVARKVIENCTISGWGGQIAEDGWGKDYDAAGYPQDPAARSMFSTTPSCSRQARSIFSDPAARSLVWDGEAPQRLEREWCPG